MGWSGIRRFFKGSQEGDGPRTVNIFLGFFFMVNFVLGTGFLGIPFGFVHGGVLPGLVALLLIAIMEWNTALWVVESMARAQALWDYKSHTGSTNANAECQFYVTIHRKFEPSEMCEVFIGRWMKIVYLIILTVLSFFAAVSYATVAGSAWSVNLPLHFGGISQCNSIDFLHQIIPADDGCLNAYRFCVFLFCVLVIPIALLDLKEQAIVQFILGVLRFFTLGAIIIYCFIHLVEGDVIANCDKYIQDNTSNDSVSPMIDLYNATSTIQEIVVKFDFNSWVVSVPVFVYAFILHQGIPSLTHPIKEKNWLRGYFNVLFAVITAFYVVLGIVVSLWFRDCTSETCTLNWSPLTKPGHSTALRVLSYYIIFFPSIDVCSVFPLLIHTIVNNIYTVIFGRDTSQTIGWKHRIIQVVMKFVAAMLPIVVALFVSNLVYVLKYAGLLGFFISLFFPILWQLTSQWICFRCNIVSNRKRDSAKGFSNEDTPLIRNIAAPESIGKSVCRFLFTYEKMHLYKTPYSTFFSHPLCVIFVLILATVWFVITIMSLFIQ